jgi:hypothetical protein
VETSSSVWKHHQACGNIIERGETLVSRVETPIKRGETSSSVGKRGGAPRRAGLSERGDAGRGGLGTYRIGAYKM